jgi:hypothetical protein
MIEYKAHDVFSGYIGLPILGSCKGTLDSNVFLIGKEFKVDAHVTILAKPTKVRLQK